MTKLICLLLLCASAWGADTTLYVNTDTGSGTTCSVGSPCASLSVAVGRIPADITTGGSQGVWTIQCEGAAADTTAVSIVTPTTSSTYYIRVTTSAGTNGRHAGVWSTSKYRLEVADAVALSIGIPNVYIDGLQIGISSQTAARYIVQLSSATNIRISNSLLRGADSAELIDGVTTTGTSSYTAWNTAVFRLGSNGNSSAFRANASGTATIYSCTAIGTSSSYGIFNNGGTMTVKNTYARAGSGYAFSGTITKTTTASSDTTGDIDNVAYSTANFTNVTAGSENLLLVSGSGLLTTGTVTSGESAPLNFTTDIVSNARGASWDIGAFQLTAGATRRRVVLIQ